LKKGSRGAGLCIDLGVTTSVELSQGERGIEIHLNGQPSDAPVTRHALEALLPGGDLHITVNSEFELPASQGFGISGAGALSAGLALMQALREHDGRGLNFRSVVEAAHCAEVLNRTGLGDVVAQVTGGFTIRRTPGLPPEENVIHMHTLHGLDKPAIVLLCVIGDETYTSKVLGDEEKRRAINRVGGRLVDEMLKAPSADLLMSSSYRFVHETGLISPGVHDVVESISEICPASMSCLGNSIFCITTEDPIADEVAQVLSGAGKFFMCSIDQQGARVIPKERLRLDGQPQAQENPLRGKNR
jgi:pantoate kinase